MPKGCGESWSPTSWKCAAHKRSRLCLLRDWRRLLSKLLLHFGRSTPRHSFLWRIFASETEALLFLNWFLRTLTRACACVFVSDKNIVHWVHISYRINFIPSSFNSSFLYNEWSSYGRLNWEKMVRPVWWINYQSLRHFLPRSNESDLSELVSAAFVWYLQPTANLACSLSLSRSLSRSLSLSLSLSFSLSLHFFISLSFLAFYFYLSIRFSFFSLSLSFSFTLYLFLILSHSPFLSFSLSVHLSLSLFLLCLFLISFSPSLSFSLFLLIISFFISLPLCLPPIFLSLCLLLSSFPFLLPPLFLYFSLISLLWIYERSLTFDQKDRNVNRLRVWLGMVRDRLLRYTAT